MLNIILPMATMSAILFGAFIGFAFEQSAAIPGIIENMEKDTLDSSEKETTPKELAESYQSAWAKNFAHQKIREILNP